MISRFISRSRVTFATFLFVLAVVYSSNAAQEIQSSVNPTAAVSLDLSSSGYHAPSRMDRLSENQPAVTLDFVDDTHVLLTFNQKKLWQRLPECPPEHEDRLMQAAIFELPSGKSIHEADWYLHDRRPYLWPLDPGEFLLRRGNELYLIDSSLHEKLLLKSPDTLLWVTVTPDARQIVIETPNPAMREANSKSQNAPKYIAQFLDAKTLVPQRTLPLNDIIDLTATSTGYADLVHKNDIWLLRFGPVQKHRHNLARVRSQTEPNVLFSSNNSLLIGRCPTRNCDYSVTAFTLNGRRLWKQHWPRYRLFPNITRNFDSSRFAISSLRLVVDPAAVAAIQADQENALQPEISQLDVFQQNVQVVETASGTPLLSLTVSPAMMSARNYAISPDGRRFAVLQNEDLQLFDLPQSSQDEQTKFADLKSDLPDFYSVSSDPDSTPLSAERLTTPSAESTNPTNDNAANSASPSTDAGTSPEAGSVPGSQPIATIRVTTKTVLVDVVVTDSKGHPIPDLRQEDFQISEDGHPQDVGSFRAFSDGDAKADDSSTTSSGAPKLDAPSPNVFTNRVRGPDTGAVTLVLFDMLNTPIQDQAYARQQLVKFIQAKPKGMQFALCTMSLGTNTHLRLVQGFTPSENVLLAAANARKATPKEPRWQVSTAGNLNNLDAVADLAKEGPTGGFQGLLSALQQGQALEQVSDTEDRSAITLESMMLLARYLSGIRGRKNIVWLSGSFPISLAATTSNNNIALDNPNYTAKIKRITNLMAEAQIAVYPVDVRGLIGGGQSASGAGGMGGPSFTGSQDFSAASMISPSPSIPSDMQALAQEAAERDTLLQFATATGGKAFFNTNGIRDAIATAAEQGSNYYTLSYNPTNKNFDGKFRMIKVQLSHKGYSLHYRQGYYADDLHASGRETELARRASIVAMQHGTPLAHQILLSVRVSPVGSKTKMDAAKMGGILAAPSKKAAQNPGPSALVEVQHYIVDYTINGSELRFLPLENSKYRNTLTVMATSFNREGRMLTGVSSLGTRELTAAEFAKVAEGRFGVQSEIDVPLEATSIRLGLQDQMSNRLGTVEISLPVPPDPELQGAAKNSLPPIEPD
ncbi:MAG: VWA domain-containing protein [Acidobacteriota bacterium]